MLELLVVLVALYFVIKYATDRMWFTFTDGVLGLVIIACACVAGAVALMIWAATRGRT